MLASMQEVVQMQKQSCCRSRPAGLMAAEGICAAGHQFMFTMQKPSVHCRKFLLARVWVA